MNINHKILTFTKEQIVKGLNKLPTKNVDFFFRMYDHNNKYNKDIDLLLNSLDFKDLNHALNQIENTKKNG